MKKHLSKRRGFVAALIVVALAIASSVAYAYWTSGGTGSGTANAANPGAVNTITLVATFADGIYPGGNKSVTFKASNSASTDGYVGAISFVSVTSSDVVPITGCQALLTSSTGQFSLTTTGGGTVIPANASNVALSITGTLTWTDLPLVNQDACKNKPLTLNVTSS